MLPRRSTAKASRYARATVQEVADDPVPRGEKDRLYVKERQGERLLKKAPGCFSVAVDPVVAPSSEELASWMGEQFNSGRGDIAFFWVPWVCLTLFCIKLIISFLIPPHFPISQPVIVLEQLYALRILNHEPYHY